jgi:hypothetical protein
MPWQGAMVSIGEYRKLTTERLLVQTHLLWRLFFIWIKAWNKIVESSNMRMHAVILKKISILKCGFEGWSGTGGMFDNS